MASYLVFSLVFGGLGIFSLMSAWLAHPSFWKPGATFIAAYAVSVLWLRSFEVRLDEVGVACASIFGKKSLRWSEIDQAEVRLSYRSKYERDEPGHAFRAPFRLVIFSKPASNKPPVRINIKLISRHDFQKLVERLEARLEKGKLDLPLGSFPFRQA